MSDPANDLLPQLSSPTISSGSSSDLDTESTGSFFHDRSTTLGTLMGVSFPAITFRAPSHRREIASASAATKASGIPSRRTKTKKASVTVTVTEQRRRRWWSLCRDDDSKPSSLGEFLEVERRFEDGEFYSDEAVFGDADVGERTEGTLFADGRVLPPPVVVEDGTSTALCGFGFPVLRTGICSSGSG